MQDKDNSMDKVKKDSPDNDIEIDTSVNTEDTIEENSDNLKDLGNSQDLEDSEGFDEYVEEEEEETSESTSQDGKSGKGSFFKREKKEKKDKKDLKIEELNDRLIRNMAEFDNFRKRSEREKAQMFEIGARDIIEKILPVIDNFERGLGTLTEEEKEGAFAKGIEKIYKQMLTTLSDAGLKTIEAVGNEFDPNFHNAVMHAEDPEMGDNIVAEEFQKGYSYRDTVIRHSMVKVVN